MLELVESGDLVAHIRLTLADWPRDEIAIASNPIDLKSDAASVNVRALETGEAQRSSETIRVQK